MQQLKQDSYPQVLRDQIRYGIVWRQWGKGSKLEEPPARPKNMLLLPHHARTIDEWMSAAKLLPKAKRDFIYSKIEPVFKPMLLEDLKENITQENPEDFFDGFLNMVPDDKRCDFAKYVFMDDSVMSLVISKEDVRACMREFREYLCRKHSSIWSFNESTKAFVRLLVKEQDFITYREFYKAFMLNISSI